MKLKGEKMKKENNIYITQELIKDEELSEYDFVLQDEFGFDHEKFDHFISICKKPGYADSQEINIDTIIKRLESFKKKGATHISLEAHTDHHGLLLSAYKITLSSPEEIEDYENNIKKRNEKQKQINKLENEIEKIKKWNT